MSLARRLSWTRKHRYSRRISKRTWLRIQVLIAPEQGMSAFTKTWLGSSDSILPQNLTNILWSKSTRLTFLAKTQGLNTSFSRSWSWDLPETLLTRGWLHLLVKMRSTMSSLRSLHLLLAPLFYQSSLSEVLLPLRVRQKSFSEIAKKAPCLWPKTTHLSWDRSKSSLPRAKHLCAIYLRTKSPHVKPRTTNALSTT